MAGYNEILAGRFNKALTRLFGMKGPAPSPSVSSEIQPVIPMFFGIENRFLEGWNRFGMTVYTAAVAAQNSEFQIRNPVANSVVAVIEKLNITVSVADLVEIRLLINATTDLANIFTTTRLDARIGNVAASSMITSQANNVVAAGSVIDHVAIAANSNVNAILFEDQEVTILPGDAIRVHTIGLNEILRVSFQWRERVLEDSEVKS